MLQKKKKPMTVNSESEAACWSDIDLVQLHTNMYLFSEKKKKRKEKHHNYQAGAVCKMLQSSRMQWLGNFINIRYKFSKTMCQTVGTEHCYHCNMYMHTYIIHYSISQYIDALVPQLASCTCNRLCLSDVFSVKSISCKSFMLLASNAK